MKTYVRGNMARFVSVFKDASGASETPTSPTFYCYDPYGQLKFSAAVSTASGISRYVYNMVTATNWDLGRYRAEFYGISSAGTVRNSVFFEIILGDEDT